MLRKKELLALPELVPGDLQGITAKASVEYLKADTTFSDPVLRIDVFQFGELILRYCADRKRSRHICWTEREGWTGKGLGSAIGNYLSNGDYCNIGSGTRWYRVTGNWDFETEDKQVVLGYLSEGIFYGTSAKRRVEGWEYDCNAKRRQEAVSARKRRIDAVMDCVPLLPEELEEWLSNTLFDQYLYARKKDGKTEYACTACGKTGTRKLAVRRGQYTSCPRCGAMVKVRTFNMHYAPEIKMVVVLQKMTLPEPPKKGKDPLSAIREMAETRDGWVERQLTAVCTASPKGRRIDIYEYVRAVCRASIYS